MIFKNLSDFVRYFRRFRQQWRYGRHPLGQTIFRALAGLLFVASIYLFFLRRSNWPASSNASPPPVVRVFPHARRISLVRAPWNTAPPNSDSNGAGPFTTGNRCCIVLSALAERGVKHQTDELDFDLMGGRRNYSFLAIEEWSKHSYVDPEHYVVAVESALRAMPDAHFFLLLESPTVISFRERFLRTQISSRRSESPRLHLVNLDLLDEHLLTLTTWNEKFAEVQNKPSDVMGHEFDGNLNRELKLLQNYLAFRDFIDNWPGVRDTCSQLLLLDSPLVLVQQSPFHAYAGHERRNLSNRFMRKRQRQNTGATTINVTAENEPQLRKHLSEEKAPALPSINEYLLFTESQERSIQRADSSDSNPRSRVFDSGSGSKLSSTADYLLQRHLAGQCLNLNAARLLFSGAHSHSSLVAAGAVLGTYAAVQRFVALQSEQIMRLPVTGNSIRCLQKQNSIRLPEQFRLDAKMYSSFQLSNLKLC